MRPAPELLKKVNTKKRGKRRRSRCTSSITQRGLVARRAQEEEKLLPCPPEALWEKTSVDLSLSVSSNGQDQRRGVVGGWALDPGRRELRVLCSARAGRGQWHLTEALQPRDGRHTVGRVAAPSAQLRVKGRQGERIWAVPPGDITAVARCVSLRDALTFPLFSDRATAALAAISPLQFLYSGT